MTSEMTARPELRRATVADAALVSRVAARLFEQTFGAANSSDDMQAYLSSTFTEALQAAEIENPHRTIIVAELGGDAVGYCSVLRGSAIESVQAARPAEVERIYVDRSLHGRRVGDQLMDACVAQATAWGSDVLWLAVWEENPRAIAFYERRGFRRVGTKDFHLGGDLQRDHVMALTL